MQMSVNSEQLLRIFQQSEALRSSSLQRIMTIFRARLKMALNYKASYFMAVILNIVSIMSFLYFSKYNPDITIFGFNASYAEFVVIGLTLQMVIGTTLNSTSVALSREIVIGTWGAIFPYFNLLEYSIGVSLAGVSLSSLSVIASLLAAFAMGLTFTGYFSLRLFLLIVILFVLILMSHMAISMLMSAHTIWFKRDSGLGVLIFQIIRTFSGVAFPVAMLSGFPFYLSRILPLTYGLDALRTVLFENTFYFRAVIWNSCVLLAFVFIMVLIAHILVKLAVNQARRNGTVEGY